MSADPHFWIENGKIYVYNGLGGPGECFEYDMQKKEVIPQSQSILASSYNEYGHMRRISFRTT